MSICFQKNRFLLFIMFSILQFLCSACMNTESIPANPAAGSSGILTDLYTSTEFPVPEDYWMIYSVTPYYDESKGTVTIFSLQRSKVETEQEIIQETTGWLHTFNQEWKTLSTERNRDTICFVSRFLFIMFH